MVPCILIYNNNLELFIRKPFNNRWLKALRAAQNELDRQLDSVFHDITVYAISGFAVNSRDKQLFSAHKTEGQVLGYDRKIKISASRKMLF